MMKLLLRADASTAMGTGHMMRCLALAQACHRMGGRASIATAQATPALIERLEANGIQTHGLRATAGTLEDAQETSRLGQQMAADWLAIDGYHFDAAYQQTIKAAGLPLLCLDDFGHAAFYAADVVLNQNVYAHKSLYRDRAPYTRLLLGTSYALLRDEFWQWQGCQRQTAPVARHLLVTLGGADPDNVTLKVIQALRLLETTLSEIRVIVGGSSPHYDSLKRAVDSSSLPIQLLKNVGNMPELMAWADLAITAGGTTAWELAFMGLPALMLILAENQRSIAETLNDQGIAVNLGWHPAVTEQQIASAIALLAAQEQTRAAMTRRGQQLVDGKGAERVLVHLKNRLLSNQTL